MNNIRKTAVCVLAAIVAAGSASAFNSFEKLAQKNMDTYLRNHQNYETKIIEKDQSLNFMVGENIFWITFEGDADGMLYTLHRRPIRLESKDISEKELNMRKEKALRVISKMNSENPFKAVLRGNQVDFEFPVYASGGAEYQKVFPIVLKTLNTVSLDSFTEEMKKMTLESDSVQPIGETMQTRNIIVVEQPSSLSGQVARSNGKVTMSNPMFQSVDKRGNVLIPYGDLLYQDNMQFLQASVEALADKGEQYTLSLQIVTPDGKTFVPSNDADMTVTQMADLSKKEKTVTFFPFGSDNNLIWKPGKYTVIFYVNGNEAIRRSINIL